MQKKIKFKRTGLVKKIDHINEFNIETSLLRSRFVVHLHPPSAKSKFVDSEGNIVIFLCVLNELLLSLALGVNAVLSLAKERHFN